ncbi:uncharacterized protein Fot_36495 [Forsythia ovata]|uniref:B3 domain-containing protein n=1 Tax=Forsythia ovata TaxID=205694 RepID=A0ABD1SPK8_9LAMI
MVSDGHSSADVFVPFTNITDAKNKIVADNQSKEEGEDRKGDPNFPSQTIKILGVTILVSNSKEKDDILEEHNLEINQKDCTETSQLSINRKRKATEFNDYLSSENNTTNTVASSRVQNFKSLDGSPSIMRRRIIGPEIVQHVEVQHEDSIIMGDEIIPYVHPLNPIIMGDEIIEQVEVDQPEDPVIMEAEIIHVEVQPEDPNHWTIRKFLTESDINGSSRLLIGRNKVLRHIAPFFTDNPSEFCQNNERIYAIVYDVDTHTGHTLTLAKWKTNSFVLINNWSQQFVKRRLLMVNDEVGLRWDAYNARLEFTVLRRHAARG